MAKRQSSIKQNDHLLMGIVFRTRKVWFSLSGLKDRTFPGFTVLPKRLGGKKFNKEKKKTSQWQLYLSENLRFHCGREISFVLGINL